MVDREELEKGIADELAELQAAYDDSDRALAEYLGVGRTDLRCLDLITRGGPHTAGQIATALGLTPGSVTALVDRLQRAGYVQRRADPSHGKRVLVSPTPRLVEAITPVVSERMARGRAQLERYSPAELSLIRDFLRTTRIRHTAFAEQLTREG